MFKQRAVTCETCSVKQPCPIISVRTKFGCKEQKIQSNTVPVTRRTLAFLSLRRSPEVGSFMG